MKFLDEYRDPDSARQLIKKIEQRVTRPWTLMEVCGGQTHSIVKYGLDQLLPKEIELVHGPGCPVCVTPLELIDKALLVAAREEVIFCSFGDMLRVPGSRDDLLSLKARGADVRIVYSPLDCLKIARENPQRDVVFFAVGFETTAPANAMAVKAAKSQGIENFFLLVSHVLVPPVMTFILQSPGNRVQAFLGPGHVCTVMGTEEYRPIVEHYDVPIAITGFEPLDLLGGIYRLICQLEDSKPQLDNEYSRVVKTEGNTLARDILSEVFEICDRAWRGLGIIGKSGFKLAYEYADFDAEKRYSVAELEVNESELCISGQILKGFKKPLDCPAFGAECTPLTPLGATMVSSEGACAAYFAHGRHLKQEV